MSIGTILVIILILILLGGVRRSQLGLATWAMAWAGTATAALAWSSWILIILVVLGRV